MNDKIETCFQQSKTNADGTAETCWQASPHQYAANLLATKSVKQNKNKYNIQDSTSL